MKSATELTLATWRGIPPSGRRPINSGGPSTSSWSAALGARRRPMGNPMIARRADSALQTARAESDILQPGQTKLVEARRAALAIKSRYSEPPGGRRASVNVPRASVDVPRAWNLLIPRSSREVGGEDLSATPRPNRRERGSAYTVITCGRMTLRVPRRSSRQPRRQIGVPQRPDRQPGQPRELPDRQASSRRSMSLLTASIVDPRLGRESTPDIPQALSSSREMARRMNRAASADLPPSF
jgi:hypothetical protein